MDPMFKAETFERSRNTYHKQGFGCSRVPPLSESKRQDQMGLVAGGVLKVQEHLNKLQTKHLQERS